MNLNEEVCASWYFEHSIFAVIFLRKDDTDLFSVGDSALDQLKTPSTMEILSEAEGEERGGILAYCMIRHLHKQTQEKKGSIQQVEMYNSG